MDQKMNDNILNEELESTGLSLSVSDGGVGARIDRFITDATGQSRSLAVKLIEGGHVMYVMYENNGLRYEMNIMFSDDTIYSIVWIYDDSHLHSNDCNH